MTLLAEQKHLIEQHQQGWPVQVVPIANALGVNVYKRTGWPNNISGRIFRSQEAGGPSGYAIEVNADHHANRRRFTIAHELAHLILHPNLVGDELFDDDLYRSGLSNVVERQANKFAQRILMPDHLLQEAIAQFGPDPTVLARNFGVSEEAMRLRLGLPPKY